MKKNCTVFLITILISSISFSQEKKVYDEGYIVKVGDKAPDFTINEAGGKTYKLSDLKGKVVMLQFTASWCSVCRTEMPFIEKEIWQENKAGDLVVIGIDRDEPVEKVLQFKRDIAVTYPLALDPGADIFGLFAQKKAGVTRNVIIDRSGKIVFLTRLFKRKEFDQMKKVIFAQLKAWPTSFKCRSGSIASDQFTSGSD
ncbi:MAG: TlpA disulfide reductase family protein [Bacteroidia bacterium]|nr:TlpA disulfide reductase family protein [Bacteroidia bacterium]